jgi:hypothetical protein
LATPHKLVDVNDAACCDEATAWWTALTSSGGKGIQTQDNLRQRIPDPPVRERPHVIKVRTLATLPVGSCYALRSNGSWGPFQV